ncbi:hypothetical protein BDV93DRAFT_595597 [Ceratobasidium sp. AG-I]|nr:hypothetical protein BDV93DRAFT_595597 [Ceratobasidium sp. AG-I]
MSLSEFCDGGLNGNITDIYCCQERFGVRHEFIFVRLSCKDVPYERIWIRLERRFSRSVFDGVVSTGTYTPNLVAKDTATIASTHEDLTGYDYHVMEHLEFRKLPLQHLINLLQVYDRMAHAYTAFKAVTLRRPLLAAAFRTEVKEHFSKLVRGTSQFWWGWL